MGSLRSLHKKDSYLPEFIERYKCSVCGAVFCRLWFKFGSLKLFCDNCYDSAEDFMYPAIPTETGRYYSLPDKAPAEALRRWMNLLSKPIKIDLEIRV